MPVASLIASDYLLLSFGFSQGSIYALNPLCGLLLAPLLVSALGARPPWPLIRVGISITALSPALVTVLGVSLPSVPPHPLPLPFAWWGLCCDSPPLLRQRASCCCLPPLSSLFGKRASSCCSPPLPQSGGWLRPVTHTWGCSVQPSNGRVRHVGRSGRPRRSHAREGGEEEGGRGEVPAPSCPAGLSQALSRGQLLRSSSWQKCRLGCSEVVYSSGTARQRPHAATASGCLVRSPPSAQSLLPSCGAAPHSSAR